MLGGLAVGFGTVATLATLATSWAADANEVSRVAALGALTIAGLAMAMPKLADAWSRPLVALGARLGDAVQRSPADRERPLWRTAVLGVATGLLWAPCAG